MKPTQNDRVLWVLKDRAWHDSHELYAFCVAHSRIAELRKRGHEIEYRRDGDRHLYRLAGPLHERTPETSGADSVFAHGEGDGFLPLSGAALVDDRAEHPGCPLSDPDQLTLEVSAA